MFWRLARRDFDAGKGAKNRRAMQKIVRSGEEPGLLAYAGDRPVGWCALAPRDRYPALARSRILAPLDERPVWSVSCFFVHREFRRLGVSEALLRAAIEHARARGAEILEGYPVEPRGGTTPAAFAWTGLARAFAKAGFVEVVRRSATRPIFRLEVRGPAKPRILRAKPKARRAGPRRAR